MSESSQDQTVYRMPGPEGRQRMVKMKCLGRGYDDEPVLREAVEVLILVNRSPGCESVSVLPQLCRYNTGGHGQRCKATHPYEDKAGKDILCPFSFDYPYALGSPGWKVPPELKEVLGEVMAP